MHYSRYKGTNGLYPTLIPKVISLSILKVNGLTEEMSNKSQFKAINCPRCGIINIPYSKLYSHCSIGFDLQSTMNYKKTSKEILNTIENPIKIQTILEVLIKKVEQLKKEKYN